MVPPPDIYPKRVIWMQEEDTLKWILVGLAADGEVQDPKDYEDVHVPLPNQPSGRVWARCPVTGKWINEVVEVSKEELAKADAAVKRASTQHHEGGDEQPKASPSPKPRRASSSPISSIHHKYAMRLSGLDEPYTDTIPEEEVQEDVEEDGVKYHFVKPSDTFQFICLKYKISADALREANNFEGKSLQTAPKKLIIPTMPPKEDTKEDALSQPTRRTSDAKVEVVNEFSPDPVAPKKPTSIINSRKEEDVQYHWVAPDDSLRWICLKYKVNANDLRKANNFTGSNLKLAPKKLIIPKSTRSTKPKKASRLIRRNTGGSGGNTAHAARSPGNSLPARLGMEDQSLVSSLLSTASFGIEEDYKLTPSSASNGQIAPMNVNVPGGTGEWQGFEGAYMSPLDVSQIGSEGAESAFVLPESMPMVHLPDVHKLSQSCDSDSTQEEQELAQMSANGSRYHDVKPTDSVEYLCLKYRVSAPALRRANIGLTGRNLQTGPKRLIIPPNSSQRTLDTSYKTKDTRETQETETVTTHDDETNTLALSDGHSTLADQATIMDNEDDRPLYHDVLPNDTLQGICLVYGISAYELRRANNFRGLNLSSAPERLVIPKNERNRSKDFKINTEEEKVKALVSHMPISRQSKKPLLSNDEARAYLEFNDWNFDQALRNIKVDTEWSSQKSQGKLS